jgi:nucleoid-associated protein YgaU
MFEKHIDTEHLFVYNLNGTNVLDRVDQTMKQRDTLKKHRYVLKNRRRFCTFLVMLTVLLCVLVFAVAVNGADSGENYETVVVKRGDTLWDLAKAYRGNTEIRRYIEKIREINGLKDSTIYEGDVIKLPL